MDAREPIVISGIGLTTALGFDRETTWKNLLAGASGATWLAGENLTGHAGYPAPWPGGIRPSGDPVHALLDQLADAALADAKLTAFDPDRAATLVGLSKGGIQSLIATHRSVLERHDDATVASHWLNSWPNSGAARVASRLGFRGPSLAPIAACATGLVAVLEAVSLIRRGACDLAIAGSADASLEPFLLAAFARMKALAKVTDDVTTAVCPWDRDRSGFLVGEGGALLVLEPLGKALSRGATPYAEVLGGAMGADAHHETALNPDPAGLAFVISQALRASRLDPSQLDAVHLHATATLGNDSLECAALKYVLGAHVSQIAYSASKAQIGHLLGAAGSAELAIAALMLRDSVIPPTRNLESPDPRCDLGVFSPVAQSRPIGTILKLSLGFGGHLAAAVLRRVRSVEG